jgi:hypothetical protein
MIGELYPGEFEAMEHNGRMDALEQEPCDVFDEYGNYKYPSDVELTEPNTATSMPCEDAISRQAVLDAMSDTWKHICFVARRRKPKKGEEAVYSDMVGTVKSIPPVKPQPKTGHWIDSPNGYFTQCSECGLHGAIGIYKHYGWCPKCGAKMVEPQEREIQDADSD